MQICWRNHKLPLITGRWLRQPRNERLCITCGKLGDEYHFVLICKQDALVSLRRRYIDSYYFLNPSMFKFVQLLTNDEKRTIRNLAVYIHKGLYSQ